MNSGKNTYGLKITKSIQKSQNSFYDLKHSWISRKKFIAFSIVFHLRKIADLFSFLLVVGECWIMFLCICTFTEAVWIFIGLAGKKTVQWNQINSTSLPKDGRSFISRDFQWQCDKEIWCPSLIQDWPKQNWQNLWDAHQKGDCSALILFHSILGCSNFHFLFL